MLFSRHVKIYDMGTYQPVHSLDYPSAILSLDAALNVSLTNIFITNILWYNLNKKRRTKHNLKDILIS